MRRTAKGSEARSAASLPSGTAAEEQRAGHPARGRPRPSDRAATAPPRPPGARTGRSPGSGVEHRPERSASARPTAAPPITRRSGARRCRSAFGADLDGSACRRSERPPLRGRPRRRQVPSPPPSALPKASAAARCRVPATPRQSPTTREFRRADRRAEESASRRSRGASRQMRFPVPDRHRRIDDQQLSVSRVRSDPGDTALRPRRDQRTRGRRVAVGAVRVEHEAYGDTTLERHERAPTDMRARPRRSRRRCCAVRRATRA